MTSSERPVATRDPIAGHRAGLEIRRACESLKTQRVRVVAESLGFCDQFQFSRRFKQVMGIPPKEFQSRFR